MTPSLLLLLAGCRPDLEEIPAGDRRHLFGSVHANKKGTAQLKIPILPGDSAFLATARVTEPWAVHFRSVSSPDKAEVFGAFEWNASPYNKTNGAFVASTATLNWPVAPEDAPLVPGDWTIEFGVVDGAQEYSEQEVAVDVLVKRDGDFTAGRLEVAVVFSGGTANDPDLRDAVREAEALWQDLYAGVGIALEFEEFGFPDQDIGPPALGDEAFVEIAEQTGIPRVNLVVSPEIVGFDQIFGIAGDIPGPMIATERSGVQVSATLAAGPDGRFSPEDTRLLAETMAHETMHFLGLFHPVESSWDAWDVLDDTEECGSELDCVAQLSDNLMFPYPVCSVASCVPQNALTEAQVEVSHRYTGVE